jgi:tRNA pseudouridine55 synthase
MYCTPLPNIYFPKDNTLYGKINPMILLNKPVGITPLQAITRLKLRHPEFRDSKLSYAGRLDPMASGLLIILVDEENRNRQSYLQLDKEYEFDLITGVATDTGDLLGKITQSVNDILIPEHVIKALTSLIGVHAVPYPAYSSKTVNGKPLWLWAKEGRIQEVVIPDNHFHIYKLQLGKSTATNLNKFYQYLSTTIFPINGDFRQAEVLAGWENYLSTKPVLTAYSCKIVCSSGTYIRSIPQILEKKLSYPFVVQKIRRLRVGNYLLENAIF